MVYTGYYKVMSNIPKMGHLTTPEIAIEIGTPEELSGSQWQIDGSYGMSVESFLSP